MAVAASWNATIRPSRDDPYRRLGAMADRSGRYAYNLELIDEHDRYGSA